MNEKIVKKGKYAYLLVNGYVMARYSNVTERMFGATKYFKKLKDGIKIKGWFRLI